MEKYLNLEMEIIVFEQEDIITTSDPTEGPDGQCNIALVLSTHGVDLS